MELKFTCTVKTVIILVALQLRSHDAGRPVQDQGREGPHPELSAVMQVSSQ